MALETKKPLPADCVTVGRIVAVFGIKGWLKLVSYTDPTENLVHYSPLWLETAGGELEKIAFDQYRLQDGQLVVHVAGVDDRDEARVYCRRLVKAEKSLLPAPPEGCYYWHQLLGLKVYSSHGAARILLGRIDELMETGANLVMKVVPCEGSFDSRERLLPYLRGHYGIEVDLTAGVLLIDWDPAF